MVYPEPVLLSTFDFIDAVTTEYLLCCALSGLLLTLILGFLSFSERNYAFNMVGVREHINALDGFNVVVVF